MTNNPECSVFREAGLTCSGWNLLASEDVVLRQLIADSRMCVESWRRKHERALAAAQKKGDTDHAEWHSEQIATAIELLARMDQATHRETVAVVYDHVGMHPQWLQHIDWLGSHVRSARWLKAHEVAWQLADWGA